MTNPSDPTVHVVQSAPAPAPVIDPAVEKTAGRIARGLSSVKNTFRRHGPTVATGVISAVVTTKLVQRRQDSDTETDYVVSTTDE